MDFESSIETFPIMRQLKKNAGEANWRQTYAISEVGEDANRHCYLNLLDLMVIYNEAIRGFVCFGENT